MSFDKAAVDAGIAGTGFAGSLCHILSTTSTNTLALAAAQAGVATGVWVADEQTAGRGRGGHTWHSAPGDGLYLSVLVRPRLFGVDALKLSLAAGVAASAAVSAVTGLKIDVRWPNDLMATAEDGVERKFGGILTESALEGGDGALAYAVIGIGMNLNHRAMPDELREVATSLFLAGGERVSREALLIALLPALAGEIALLEASPQGICRRFERYSTWVRHMEVHVAEDDGYTGVTDGLDRHGLLRVRLLDGSLRTVRHGGVRRAGVAGTFRQEM